MRVMAVCPNMTDTELVRNALKGLRPEAQELARSNMLRPIDIAAAAKNLILHGQPGEVVSVNKGKLGTINKNMD